MRMTVILFGAFVFACIGGGCSPGDSPPADLESGTPGGGVSIAVEKDSFTSEEKIDFRLLLDLEQFDGLVCPCVDSTLVWPVLSRDGEIVKNIPFRSDVGEPETGRVIEVDSRRFCCVDAAPASQIATLSFRVPLNYDDPTNKVFKIFEVPPGEYRLRVFYRFNAIANDCWGCCGSHDFPRGDEPEIFGADVDLESNVVSFVVR